jgi:transcription initiation factor TFIID subunit 12
MKMLIYVCISGTPAHIKPLENDELLVDDKATRARRLKNSAADASMRRTIQDLVASVDPNVKIEPEVEDVSLLFHPSGRR